jgi:hypothetical protein
MEGFMSDHKRVDTSAHIDRRELVRKGAKAAYIVPAVLAAVKATDRPAYAQTSGPPVLDPP